MVDYFTSTTQLWVPKELGTQAVQRGSFTHAPSTKNLYSCLPGLRDVLTNQLPLESFLATSFLESHLLKLPDKTTFFAVGA